MLNSGFGTLWFVLVIWLAARWTRLSTGLKMLLILSLGLLPLGIIAILAATFEAKHRPGSKPIPIDKIHAESTCSQEHFIAILNKE